MLVGICNPVLNKDKICNLKLDSDIRLSLLSIMVPACAGKTNVEYRHCRVNRQS